MAVVVLHMATNEPYLPAWNTLPMPYLKVLQLRPPMSYPLRDAVSVREQPETNIVLAAEAQETALSVF
jgi:hypothetical protein